MTETPSPNLRERKKAETWTTLHEAAASLAQQRGLEHATVEAIAESAGVSPRTFFNKFPIKEDAVLGLREPFLDRINPDSTPPAISWTKCRVSSSQWRGQPSETPTCHAAASC